MYEVIKFFTDLKDHDRPYHVGDTYPRKGLEVDEARLAELSSSANKQGVPLIKKISKGKEPVRSEVAVQEPLAESVSEPKVENVEDKPKPKRTRKSTK